MSELAPQTRNHLEEHSGPETGANASLLQEMLSEEGKQRYRMELEEEIAEDPALSHLQQIRHDFDRAVADCKDERGLILDGKHEEYNRAYDRYKQRQDFAENQLWGEEAAYRFFNIDQELRALDGGRVLMRGPSGRQLLEDMLAHTPEESRAAARLFVAPQRLDSLQRLSGEEEYITIAFTRAEEPVEIPLNYFISAEGMDSWLGRGRAGEAAKDGRSSLETIHEYARAETTPPPIEDLTGYVLPDGRVYFKSNNAHRLAAAIRRGDSTLKFQGSLSMNYLNRLPPELAKQESF